MKKKRTQQSAWRRRIDNDVALATQVRQRAITREQRSALSRQGANTMVGTGALCMPSDCDTLP
jgi:hypothetical protein